ncbi:hypothetical protein EPN96_07465 [bacterium]|nr:MAG: hypothetical protein EPN96_07465 [bacterium]
MANDLISKIKPGAPVWLHLFLASLLWSAVGVFLLYRGGAALLELSMPEGAAALGAGVLLGWFKGAKVLRPAAKKSAARIIKRGDGKCVGGFLSWKSWLFVAGMGFFGKWLRGAGVSPLILGPLLTGVGLALLSGAQIFFGAFVKKLPR